MKAQEGKERAISTPVCDGMQRDQQRTSKQKHENGWMGGGVGVGGGTADLCCRDTYGQRKPRHCSSHSNRSADLHAFTTARPPARVVRWKSTSIDATYGPDVPIRSNLRQKKTTKNVPPLSLCIARIISIAQSWGRKTSDC